MEDLLLAVPFGLAVGLSLGLVGAGGSLLTVPILVYVFDQPPEEATTATLFIVGLTAVAGVAAHAPRGMVRWRIALPFGAAAALGTIGGTAANRAVDEDTILVAFGCLMLVGALALVRGGPAREGVSRPVLSPFVLGAGLAVGVLTGFFGVGGGFVIVPVLVLGLGLPIEAAIASSLVVIAIASAVALAGHLATGGIDWALTGVFTAAATVGALSAGQLGRRVPTRWLTWAFALLVAGLGVFMIVKSLRAIG